MNVTLADETDPLERRRMLARSRRLEKRAKTLAGAGRVEEAIACQSEVTDLRPNDPAAFFRLGLLYREARRIDPAVSALRRATSLNPAQRDPREALIATLLDGGRYQDIIDEGRALVKIDPRSVFARDVLSLAYMQLGLGEKAMRVVGELIWLDPINPDHYLKRAMLLQQQGDMQHAVAEYTRVQEMTAPGSEASEVAAAALDTLDERQLQQIIVLAAEDQLFQWKVTHDSEEALAERGFHLTPDGHARLNYLLQFPVPAAFPSSAPGHVRLYN